MDSEPQPGSSVGGRVVTAAGYEDGGRRAGGRRGLVRRCRVGERGGEGGSSPGGREPAASLWWKFW